MTLEEAKSLLSGDAEMAGRLRDSVSVGMARLRRVGEGGGPAKMIIDPQEGRGSRRSPREACGLTGRTRRRFDSGQPRSVLCRHGSPAAIEPAVAPAATTLPIKPPRKASP